MSTSNSDSATGHAALQGQEMILQVENLSVDFLVDEAWNPAVANLSFNLARGETLAIVGESGSGKSTSALALTKLLAANSRVSGSVKLNGQDIFALNKKGLRAIRGGEIAYIFQEPMTALNPLFSIGFQIAETLLVHTDLDSKAAKQRALELIALVDLPNPELTYNKFPHQLSGGQRQRALIAQAISCDPVVLIADEPTTALDVTVQAEILDLLRNLQQRTSMAILLITHDMGVVADFADRVLVMKDGIKVEEDTCLEVFFAPTAEYTKELLAAVPTLGASTRELFGATPSTTPSTKPTLSLQNVSIDYPKTKNAPAFRAVNDVSLDIYPGETVGLVGESGSGKSTIGRAAVGLLSASAGVIELSGGAVGMVFQDPNSSLNPRLPIGFSIGEGLLLAGVAKGKALSKIVESLLEQVELPSSFINRYPHELSGGQRQRVGIARALSLSPSLLIADEPTSALDVSVQARFLELLNDLQNQLRFACLFISHDLAVVDSLADRIVVLRQGSIVEQGTPSQIFRSPTHEYTQQLVSCVPVPDPREQAIRRQARLARLAAITEQGRPSGDLR